MANLALHFGRGELLIQAPGRPGGLRTATLFNLLLPGSPGSAGERIRPVPIAAANTLPTGELRLTGGAHGFRASAAYHLREGAHTAYYDVTVTLTYEGAEPMDAALQFAYDLQGEGEPTWLIPGAFYRENRVPECARIYPRYDAAGGDPQHLVADSWSFRADRAALPAVFAWNGACSAALATDEVSAIGMSGMGFVGNAKRTAIWLNFPYREEPVVFLAPDTPGPADRPTYRWTPGQTVTLRYRVHLGEPDLHAYDPFVRELYDLVY